MGKWDRHGTAPKHELFLEPSPGSRPTSAGPDEPPARPGVLEFPWAWRSLVREPEPEPELGDAKGAARLLATLSQGQGRETQLLQGELVRLALELEVLREENGRLR